MSEHLIERLGHQGDGIAEGPVFAPVTLPGERVSGTLEGSILREVRVLTPSDQRVSPPCRHFKSCGGCQLQHASDPFVADWKLEIVERALAAQGLETQMRPILTSPPRSRRRATIAARRTKKGAMAGFFARGSDVIVEVPDCQLVDPGLLPGFEVAREMAIAGGSRKGSLAVTVTLSEAGLDVAVSGGKPLDGPLRALLAQLCERLSLARLAWDDELIAQRVPPVQDFAGVRVVPPPGAFLQATREGEQALREAVREAIGKADAVADLFAGSGTFTFGLAQAAPVHAVEGSAEMIAALDLGWRHASGLKEITSETRDLFRRPLLGDELRLFDAVLLDPPRAGAEAQVAELARAHVPRIAYVSCNPVTFARDAAQLTEAGYRLEWVQVVDQFRWSAHVELAALFTVA